MQKPISSDTSIDLHMHTTYSDGRWSAEQLLDYLTQEGFGLIAVTDHDRVETVAGPGGRGDQRTMAREDGRCALLWFRSSR